MPIRLFALAIGLFALLSAVAAVPESGVAQSSSQFEREPCSFPLPAVYPQELVRECGHLIVPEVRGATNARTFKLAVVIYKPSEPDGTLPLLLLHGGPGPFGGTRFAWREVGLPEVRKRDVVVFDMRGVGLSEPRLCPDFLEYADKSFLLPTRREWEDGYRQSVKKCVAQLDAQGFDRNAYGSDVSAADAIDLRRALNYPAWDVYGVSYGGIVAQELLRRDPGGTRAAALISTSPPGPDYAGHFSLARQRRLEIVAAECKAQPVCSKLSPDVVGDFSALFQEFSTKPATVVIPGTAPERRVLLNGEYFVMNIQLGARLPLLLHELRRGDREAAARRLVGNGPISAWGTLGHLAWCNEYGATYRQSVAETVPRLLPGFRSIADDFREHCDIWLPKPTRQHDRRPIVSRAPVLVTYGQFDPMELPETQRKMTAGFTRAYTYVLPGVGHATPPLGCHGTIIRQFLADPFREPDSSCLSRMRGIRYPSTFEPVVTLTITSEDASASPLTGEWEATLGNSPDGIIELHLQKGQLTGLVGQFPVFDGRMDATSLSFRVNSDDNARTITFKATLTDDTLVFTREVEVRSGRSGRAAGPGLLGGTNLKGFVARRPRVLPL